MNVGRWVIGELNGVAAGHGDDPSLRGVEPLDQGVELAA